MLARIWCWCSAKTNTHNLRCDRTVGSTPCDCNVDKPVIQSFGWRKGASDDTRALKRTAVLLRLISSNTFNKTIIYHHTCHTKIIRYENTRDPCYCQCSVGTVGHCDLRHCDLRHRTSLPISHWQKLWSSHSGLWCRSHQRRSPVPSVRIESKG